MSHKVLREQKTASPGRRPGVLKEPDPQMVDAVLSYRVVSVPLLGPPLLSPAPEDDFIALGFLEEMALKTPEQVERMRRVERERKRKEEDKEEEEAKPRSLFFQPVSSSSSQTKKRFAVRLRHARPASAASGYSRPPAAALEVTPFSVCVVADIWNDHTGGVMSSAACGSSGASFPAKWIQFCDSLRLRISVQ